MRILQIEDNAAIACSMAMMLEAEGFKVDGAEYGEEAIELATLYGYDAITLDLGLPDMSGMEALRRLRTAKVVAPILILTGEGEVETKIKAFGLGADDFMTKPFHAGELVARLQALIRRSKGHAAPAIEIGLIKVNIANRSVWVGSKRVHLTGKEYQIMEVLAVNKGRVMTKESVMDHLYAGRDEPELKIVDVFVCKLRKKLRALGAGEHLETEWGRGYILRDEPSAATTPGIGHPRPHTPLETSMGRVLVGLSSGGLTSTELAKLLAIDKQAGCASAGTAIFAGLAKNTGSRKGAFYEITPEGLFWLAENGFTPKLKAAA
jgi:two-component system cell cycle response regulator CtrA